jgi:hypothetical protein
MRILARLLLQAEVLYTLQFHIHEDNRTVDLYDGHHIVEAD